MAIYFLKCTPSVPKCKIIFDTVKNSYIFYSMIVSKIVLHFGTKRVVEKNTMVERAGVGYL